MIDVNAEAEKTLSKLDRKVEYYYPEKFNDMPVVSFYNLTEQPDFISDNEEDIQSGTVVVDIWSDNPADCGNIGLKVNEVMTADAWHREFSRDLPPTDGIYHRTMRFTKIFSL
ncbi:MAG: hypothetical protein IJX57_06035 [Clostridia bacterium]|nr:hypothetical protein [Clostridia bacterium]